MMESTYSVSSLDGFVSSNRKLHFPPNSSANPKFKWMDLAWPICRYPFGSGGKRVWTRPPYLLVFKSWRMISRMKFDWAGAASVSVGVVFIVSSSKGNTGRNACATAFVLLGRFVLDRRHAPTLLVFQKVEEHFYGRI